MWSPGNRYCWKQISYWNCNDNDIGSLKLNNQTPNNDPISPIRSCWTNDIVDSFSLGSLCLSWRPIIKSPMTPLSPLWPLSDPRHQLWGALAISVGGEIFCPSPCLHFGTLLNSQKGISILIGLSLSFGAMGCAKENNWEGRASKSWESPKPHFLERGGWEAGIRLKLGTNTRIKLGQIPKWNLGQVPNVQY